MNKRLTVLLISVVVIEAVVCGLVLAQYALRVEPVLPTMSWDDPLVGGELALLADQARTGGSAQWLQLAQALLGQGAYSFAEISFRQALKLDRTNHSAQFGLAFCLDRMGRIEESTGEYQKLTPLRRQGGKLARLGTESLYAVGRNFLRTERAADAEEVFLQLPDYLPAIHQLAKLDIGSGRAKQALPLIAAGLEKVPNSLEFVFLQFRAERALGNDAAAILTMDALERAREQVNIHFNTGYVGPFFYRQGLERKVSEYNKLIATKGYDTLSATLNDILSHVQERRSPYRRVALMGLLEVALQQQDADAISKRLEELGDFGEQNVDMLQLEGAAASFHDDLPAAIDLWNRAARMSTSIQLEQHLASAYQQQGDMRNRDLHLAKARLLEGLTAFRSEQVAAAEAPLQKSVQLNPLDAQAWFYLAQTQRTLGRVKAAKDSYQRCLQVNPNHGRALQWLKILNQPKDI
jgi:Tfp pilus assembly protein PilF